MDWRSPDRRRFRAVLDDVASVTLSTALSALAARQRVSADNIANIETPNFRAGQVSFEDSLRQAVAAGDPSQAGVSVSPTNDPAGINGNNVNLDTETLSNVDTVLRYQFASQSVDNEFSLVQSAMKTS
jgi:flagellar basal-body rod protein FlgB